MNQSITIRIPQGIKKALKDLSKSENIPLSDLVRESLQRYIALRRFRKIRGKVLPFAEAQGLLTDEDIFKALS